MNVFLCTLTPCRRATASPLWGFLCREWGGAYGHLTAVIVCHGGHMIKKVLISNSDWELSVSHQSQC